MTIRGKTLRNNTILYSILVIFVVFFLFPVIYMLGLSFMENKESMAGIRLFPSKFYFGAYKIMVQGEFISYFFNTLKVIGFNIIAVPLSALLCAYGFGRLKFKGRDTVFMIMLSTMMLPAMIVMVPLYVLFARFGWLNTLYPLTLPNIFGGGAINIFLIRQFMRGVPKELDSAAKIDGANSFTVLWKIIFPSTRPIILFIMISVFIGNWNDFTGPLIYLSDEKVYTLGLGIYHKLFGNTSIIVYPNTQMAAGVSMLIPPIILFFIFQKQLIDGIHISGLKG